ASLCWLPPPALSTFSTPDHMRALLGLALVGLTAATACGGKRAGAGGRGLTYYESYDPRSLDPALSTDVPTGEMVTLAFDGLTQFDADGRLLPALADRWTTGQDGSGSRYEIKATSELQSRFEFVCRLLLEKKKT